MDEWMPSRPFCQSSQSRHLRATQPCATAMGNWGSGSQEQTSGPDRGCHLLLGLKGRRESARQNEVCIQERRLAGWLKHGEMGSRVEEGRRVAGPRPRLSPAGDGEAGERHHQGQEQAMRRSDEIKQGNMGGTKIRGSGGAKVVAVGMMRGSKPEGCLGVTDSAGPGGCTQGVGEESGRTKVVLAWASW